MAILRLSRQLPKPHGVAAPFTLALLLVAACDGAGILDPRAVGPGAAHPSVIVNPSYSTFDTRAEFNAAAAVDQLNGFDEFSGEMVYNPTSPWTSHGVTYTSDPIFVLAPEAGMGIQSNSVATEFGQTLTTTLGADDAFTVFGADLTTVNVKAPVGIVVTTNLGSYSFPNLDVPLAAGGRRFFGIALSTSGEYLTGVRFSIGGPASAVLLDNVAVGHVGLKTQNTAPEAAAGGAYTGSEGSPVALAFSATDADSDPLTYSWDLGDGTLGSGPTPPTSHTYADNGTYQIMLAVDDGNGGVDTARTSATISNVAPTLSEFSVPTTPLAMAGGVATLPVSVSFSDPGTADTHTATLDCGTGDPVTSPAPNGMATGMCSFTSPGVYTVKVTVLDDDGGSDTKVASGQVVVYSASAGWLSGGGWIPSPAGANLAAPSSSGKLAFEVVARYKAAGSATPDGSAEFRLNVGTLDFRSTSLDWLTVGETSARLQGRGTLNGGGDYAFAVIASNGTTGDGMRIRIWQRATGAVVYDSSPGDPLNTELVTLLGGGRIQLH